MRTDFYIAILQPSGGVVPAVYSTYYEGMLSAGPYATHQDAEEALNKHFTQNQLDRAEYTIIPIFSRG
jgi:hypothetical protein